MDRGGGAKARRLRVRRRPKLSGDVAAFAGVTFRPIRRAFELAASMSLKVWRARRVAARSMRRLAEFAVGFLERGRSRGVQSGFGGRSGDGLRRGLALVAVLRLEEHVGEGGELRRGEGHQRRVTPAPLERTGLGAAPERFDLLLDLQDDFSLTMSQFGG